MASLTQRWPENRVSWIVRGRNQAGISTEMLLVQSLLEPLFA